MYTPNSKDELGCGVKASIKCRHKSNPVNPVVTDCWHTAGRLLKIADLSLEVVKAKWLISVWPLLFFGGNVLCFVTHTHTAQSHSRRYIFFLILPWELSSGNRDIPLQILKWRLLLLSKVKLIRSSRPTGRCLVHINTFWSPAQVPVTAISESE